MPRILGVDIPNDKRTIISLRYIYGIGPFLATQLCERAAVDPDKRARELTEDELAKLATCSITSTSSKVSSAVRSSRTSPGSETSAVIAASGTARVSRSTASGPAPTPGPARDPERRSPARRASRRCVKAAPWLRPDHPQWPTPKPKPTRHCRASSSDGARKIGRRGPSCRPRSRRVAPASFSGSLDSIRSITRPENRTRPFRYPHPRTLTLYSGARTRGQGQEAENAT